MADRFLDDLEQVIEKKTPVLIIPPFEMPIRPPSFYGMLWRVPGQVPWDPLFWHTFPLYDKSCPECQSGLNSGISYFWQVRGNRSYWGIFEGLFSDYWLSGPKSKTGDITGRKTGLIIPYCMADRFSGDLEQAIEKRTPVLISSLFTQDHVIDKKFFPSMQ
jgi:hypothetical protein